MLLLSFFFLLLTQCIYNAKICIVNIYIDMTLIFFPPKEYLKNLSEIIIAVVVVPSGMTVPNSNLT